MKSRQRIAGIVLGGALVLGMSGGLRAQAAAGEDLPPWSVGLGGGYIKYEGDEATKGGGDIFLRLGYDYSPRWTFRGEITYFPQLKANEVYDYGQTEPRPGLDGASTWAAGLAGDVLFHLLAEGGRRWDPHLIGGIGLLHYEKSRAWRAQTDVPVRAGVGLAYNFTPAWAVNLDVMGQMTLDKQEFNLIPSAGVAWRWGAPAARTSLAAGGAGALESDRGAADAAAAVAAPTLRLEFDTDKTVIRPEYFEKLDGIGRSLTENKQAIARIEGHADKRKTSKAGYNQKLSERRAAAVADYLHLKHGIAPSRMTTEGYGFNRPLAPNDPVSGHPQNRRAEIFVKATN